MEAGGAAGSPTVAREVIVASAVYSLDTVKKAAYRFVDRAAATISINGSDIICAWAFAPGTSAATADTLVRDFQVELLDQDLRRTVAEETAPIRNAILALAFNASKPTERE